MIKHKNIIVNFVFIILSAIGVFIVINAALHRDYPTLAEFLSAILGFAVYRVIDSKVIKLFGKRVKNQDLFNILIWIAFIVLFIISFVASWVFRNTALESVNKGLIYPSIYFSVKYWNKWTGDNGSSIS